MLGDFGDLDEEAILKDFEAIAAEDMPPMPDLMDLPLEEETETPPTPKPDPA